MIGDFQELQYERGVSTAPRVKLGKSSGGWSMPVYRVTETAFEPLDQTSFEREGILERQGIQARLRDRPEVLEEGL